MKEYNNISIINISWSNVKIIYTYSHLICVTLFVKLILHILSAHYEIV